MKKLIVIFISVMFQAAGQYYVPIFDSTNFTVTGTGAKSNVFLSTNVFTQGSAIANELGLRATDFTLWDDFQRANVTGTLGTGPNGITWDVRGGFATWPAQTTNVFIRNHQFKSTPPSSNIADATYAIQVFSNNITRIGSRANWTVGVTNSGSSEATLAIIVSKDATSLQNMIHWIIIRSNYFLQISDSISGSSFDTILSGPVYISTNGQSCIFDMQINGNTVTLNVNGIARSVTDYRVARITGKYGIWEHFYTDNKYKSVLNIESAWAGTTHVGQWVGNVFSSTNGNTSIGYTNNPPVNPSYSLDVNSYENIKDGLYLNGQFFSANQGTQMAILGTSPNGVRFFDETGVIQVAQLSKNVSYLYSYQTNAIGITNQSGNNNYINILGNAGTNSFVRFFSGGTNKWQIGTTSTNDDLMVAGTGSSGMVVSVATTAKIKAAASQDASSYYAELYGAYDNNNLGGVRTSQGDLIRQKFNAASGNGWAAYVGDGDVITILASGNVGINQNTPTYKLDVNGTGNFAGKLLTVASGTGAAGLNLPHGAAPTSPVNGDIWTTTSGIFARINGTTVQINTTP